MFKKIFTTTLLLVTLLITGCGGGDNSADKNAADKKSANKLDERIAYRRDCRWLQGEISRN